MQNLYAFKTYQWGFKVYSLTASEEPVILNMQIFDGISQDITTIVTNLVISYANEGHGIFMDRFYSSPKVFKTLLDYGFGVHAAHVCKID